MTLVYCTRCIPYWSFYFVPYCVKLSLEEQSATSIHVIQLHTKSASTVCLAGYLQELMVLHVNINQNTTSKNIMKFISFILILPEANRIYISFQMNSISEIIQEKYGLPVNFYFGRGYFLLLMQLLSYKRIR